MSCVASSNLLGRLFFSKQLLFPPLISFCQSIYFHRTGVTESAILPILPLSKKVQFCCVQLKEMYRHHKQDGWLGDLTNSLKTSTESLRLIGFKESNSSALNVSLDGV